VSPLNPLSLSPCVMHGFGCTACTTPGAKGFCPGRKPPCLVVRRPARPYKSSIQNRFTAENSMGPYAPIAWVLMPGPGVLMPGPGP
jgi:hypothetical protein